MALSAPPIAEPLGSPRPSTPRASDALDFLHFAPLEGGLRDWACDAVGAGPDDAALRMRLAFRVAPLSFYRDAVLLAVEDGSHAAGAESFFVARAGAAADRLDWSSGTLHEMNRLWELDLGDDARALDYSRFFCFFTGGRDTPFRIVEPASRLPWRSDADRARQHEAALLLQPATVVARDASDLIRAAATMLHKSDLYRVDLAIVPAAMTVQLPGEQESRSLAQGEVVMLNYEIIAQALPVIAPQESEGPA